MNLHTPLIADEGVVEFIVDHQQLGDQPFVQQAWDELHYSGLHALAHCVQLLLSPQVRSGWGGEDHRTTEKQTGFIIMTHLPIWES